jgi:hypothetical protein
MSKDVSVDGLNKNELNALNAATAEFATTPSGRNTKDDIARVKKNLAKVRTVRGPVVGVDVPDADMPPFWWLKD